MEIREECPEEEQHDNLGTLTDSETLDLENTEQLVLRHCEWV